MHRRRNKTTFLLIVFAITSSLVVGVLITQFTTPNIPANAVDSPTPPSQGIATLGAGTGTQSAIAMASASRMSGERTGVPAESTNRTPTPTRTPVTSASTSPTGTPVEARPTLTPLPSTPTAVQQVERTYVVRPGDSLITIAEAFGVSVAAIQRRNDLTSTTLQPGRELIIPRADDVSDAEVVGEGEQIYVVQAGDNLMQIATQFGVTVDALRARNNLSDNALQVAQELIIPVVASPSPSSP